MSTWNKIVLGCKMFFGGFDSAVQYLLKVFNQAIARDKYKENIQKYRLLASTVLKYMHKYEGYCPTVWTVHYRKLLTAMETFIVAFEDNQITPEELDKAIAAIKDAISEWTAD